MPRLVSLQAKRFKRWLLRFNESKPTGGKAPGVEEVPLEVPLVPVPLLPSSAIGEASIRLSDSGKEGLAHSTNPDGVSTTDDSQSAGRIREHARGLSINDLPKEIFIRILSYDDDTNEGYTLPLLASWTCSRWRHVVLHTPTLWSTLRLCCYGVGLPEVLLRSGGCGIDFVLDSTSAMSITFPRDLSALFDILRPHFRRIRSLNLVLPDHDCLETALADLCGVVPNLEALELSLPYDACSGLQVFTSTLRPDIANVFGVLGCGSGEKLHVLKLRAVTFPWYDVAFSHLTTLCMASMCTEDTMIEWEQLAETLIRNSATLEVLELDQCEFQEEDDGLAYPVIALPKLKYLRLRLVAPPLIAKLLSHVSMPNLETLELEFDADDQCEVLRALFPATSNCPEKEPTKTLSRVRNLTIQGGAYHPDTFCEIISRTPELERLMLGGCIVTEGVIRTLLLPCVARKLTEMWLELCENYCEIDLQRLVRARCGGVRVHEIGRPAPALVT